MCRNIEAMYQEKIDPRNFYRVPQRKASGRLPRPLYLPDIHSGTTAQSFRKEFKSVKNFVKLPAIAPLSPTTASTKITKSKNYEWPRWRKEDILDKHYQRLPDISGLKRNRLPNIFPEKSAISVMDPWKSNEDEIVGEKVLDRYRRRLTDLDQETKRRLPNTFSKKSAASTVDPWNPNKNEIVGKHVLDRQRRRIIDLDQEFRRKDSVEEKCRHWLLASSYFEIDE